MTEAASSTAAASSWATAARCLALDAVAATACDLLAANGIPVVLIKGPATARWLYPLQPSARPYTDVDLLVDDRRFDDAQQVLGDNGYEWMLEGVRPGEFPSYETPWRAPGAGDCVIDLHRGFAGVSDPTAFFADVWATREQLPVAGSTVFIPGRTVTAAILALHAANPGRGRKPLTDIHRAHDLFDREIWAGAAGLATRWAAESAYRAGLELLPDGRQLADDLGVGGTVRADQWLAGRQRNRVSVNLAKALAEDGIGSAAVHLIRRVLPSPAFVRLWDVPARRGPGWLALAYLRRIGRTISSAHIAVGDVYAARRALERHPRPSRTGVLRRRVLALDPGTVRTAGWALLALRSARHQLRHRALREVDLGAPAAVRAKDRRAAVATLRVAGASCLERSLVLQRFDAAAGCPRDLIIGVTAPESGFRAHAWLAGEELLDGSFQEITRHRPPGIK